MTTLKWMVSDFTSNSGGGDMVCVRYSCQNGPTHHPPAHLTACVGMGEEDEALNMTTDSIIGEWEEEI